MERPSYDNADQEAWFRYVYVRPNPKGLHQEYWQHIFGCRQWLVVERDTVTHSISSVEFARKQRA